MIFGLIQTAPVPEIGPVIVSYRSLCRLLSASGGTVTCDAPIAGRLALVHLAAGSLSRDLEVVTSALGLAASPEKSGRIRLVLDPTVEHEEEQLRSAEAAIVWDPCCRMAKDALDIIVSANEPLDKLNEQLGQTDLGDVLTPTTAAGLAQFLCRAGPKIPAMAWLAEAPTLEEGMRDEGRVILTGQQLLGTPDPLARLTVDALDIRKYWNASQIHFRGDSRLLASLDSEVRFDPIDEKVKAGYRVNYGASRPELLRDLGSPFGDPKPLLREIYHAASLAGQFDVKRAMSVDLVEKEEFKSPVPVGWAPTWSSALLAWTSATRQELVAPISPVRDGLVAWPANVEKLSLAQILRGPKTSVSAATTWSGAIEDRGPTWNIALSNGVLVVQNSREFLDSALWQPGFDENIGEALLSDHRPIDQWVKLAQKVDPESLRALARVPIFDSEFGFCQSYPALRLLGHLKVGRRKEILDAPVGKVISIAFAEAPADFQSFAEDAKLVGPSLDFMTADHLAANLTEILQPDYPAALPTGVITFQWTRNEKGLALHATLLVPQEQADMSEPLSVKNSNVLYDSVLRNLQRS